MTYNRGCMAAEAAAPAGAYPVFQAHFSSLRDQPGFGRVYRRFTGRPAWVWGTAALIGLLPFALLIAVLAVAAILVTAVVYAVLAGVYELLTMIGSRLGPAVDDGRRNVRPLPRD